LLIFLPLPCLLPRGFLYESRERLHPWYSNRRSNPIRSQGKSSNHTVDGNPINHLKDGFSTQTKSMGFIKCPSIDWWFGFCWPIHSTLW
jgi:hypothetical protein